MKPFKYILCSFLIALFVSFFIQSVFAEESIKSFDVTLTAQKDGEMIIQEEITYDFGDDYRHGIYRTIPLVSKVGDLFRVIKIEFDDIKRDNRDEPFTIDKTSQSIEAKIGDGDKTISGEHTYLIRYHVQNGIGSNYQDHDEIFWNVTGNEWKVPIATAAYTIQTDFGLTPENTLCFTGSFGSKNTNCQIQKINESSRVILTKPLSSYEGLSVVSSFPVNTFPKSELQETPPSFDPDFIDLLKILIPIYIFLNLIVAPYLVYWYFKHKNKKRFGPPAVNFDIPEYPKGKRISPAEAGTVDNTKLDRDDIVATLFDLAIRKYIKIEQIKKKGAFLDWGASTDYKLVKLKEFDDLTGFETTLTAALFRKQKSVLMKDAKLEFNDYSDLETRNFESLVKRGFYLKNPKTQRSALLTFGIILTVTLSFFLGPVLIWLSRKWTERTALGDEIDWQIDGLKLFLKNMKRHYKWQADNDYFVEKYIPYAMALGFIDQYMKQLKLIDPNYNPSWYSGQGNFYTIYPYLGSSFSNNITTTAPSSSSGYSGGGFSGGGGGGGGGGSW